MKNKKVFCVIVITSQLILSSTAIADTCFKDIAEMKKNELEIPDLFKKLPLYIAGESALGGAAITIRALGNVVSYTYFMRKGWVKSNNEGEIKEVCVNKENSSVEIKLNNTTSFKGSYAEKSVNIQGIALKKISAEEFKKTVSEKYSTGAESSAGSSAGSPSGSSTSEHKKSGSEQ